MPINVSFDARVNNAIIAPIKCVRPQCKGKRFTADPSNKFTNIQEGKFREDGPALTAEETTILLLGDKVGNVVTGAHVRITGVL